MKLSEAAALGNLALPMGHHGYCGFEKTSGCILEMAALAVGLSSWHSAHAFWPWLLDEVPNCPIADCSIWHQRTNLDDRKNYFWLVIHLFDHHVTHSTESHCPTRWTFEQLLDWIRSVEPQETVEEEITGQLAEVSLK